MARSAENLEWTLEVLARTQTLEQPPAGGAVDSADVGIDRSSGGAPTGPTGQGTQTGDGRGSGGALG